MTKRGVNIEKSQPETTKIEEKVEEPKVSNRDKYYKQVYDDIKNSFEQSSLSEDYLRFDTKTFVEMFYSLLQEDNYINDAKKAESIFNRTSSDFLHAIEKCDWDSADITDKLMLEKALLEIRRPTKMILRYYEAIEPIIEHLKEDDSLMEMVSDLRIDLIDNEKAYTSTNYTPKQSKLAGGKRYKCSVPCYGLHGQNTLDLFEVHDGMWGRDEEHVKNRFIDFLKRYFPNVKYKQEDIMIEEM